MSFSECSIPNSGLLKTWKVLSQQTDGLEFKMIYDL